MKPTLGTLLTQDGLLAGELVLLVLRRAAHGAHAQQSRPNELKVSNQIFHDGTVGRPGLSVYMIDIFVPVVQRAAARPEAALVVPGAVVRVLPPDQVQEAGELHQMPPRVGEEDLEFLVGVRAGEADALHAEIDGHGWGVVCGEFQLG